jgi:hypothetical protein
MNEPSYIKASLIIINDDSIIEDKYIKIMIFALAYICNYKQINSTNNLYNKPKIIKIYNRGSCTEWVNNINEITCEINNNDNNNKLYTDIVNQMYLELYTILKNDNLIDNLNENNIDQIKDSVISFFNNKLYQKDVISKYVNLCTVVKNNKKKRSFKKEMKDIYLLSNSTLNTIDITTIIKYAKYYILFYAIKSVEYINSNNEPLSLCNKILSFLLKSNTNVTVDSIIDDLLIGYMLIKDDNYLYLDMLNITIKNIAIFNTFTNTVLNIYVKSLENILLNVYTNIVLSNYNLLIDRRYTIINNSIIEPKKIENLSIKILNSNKIVNDLIIILKKNLKNIETNILIFFEFKKNRYICADEDFYIYESLNEIYNRLTISDNSNSNTAVLIDNINYIIGNNKIEIINRLLNGIILNSSMKIKIINKINNQINKLQYQLACAINDIFLYNYSNDFLNKYSIDLKIDLKQIPYNSNNNRIYVVNDSD